MSIAAMRPSSAAVEATLEPVKMSKELELIVTERDFDSEVLTAEGLVLAGFWADWSGACHVMTPVVEAVARNLAGRIEVVLVDVDRAPALKSRYCVESVPSLLFFHRGRLVEKAVGTVPRSALLERAELVLAELGAKEM